MLKVPRLLLLIHCCVTSPQHQQKPLPNPKALFTMQCFLGPGWFWAVTGQVFDTQSQKPHFYNKIRLRTLLIGHKGQSTLCEMWIMKLNARKNGPTPSYFLSYEEKQLTSFTHFLKKNNVSLNKTSSHHTMIIFSNSMAAYTG